MPFVSMFGGLRANQSAAGGSKRSTSGPASVKLDASNLGWLGWVHARQEFWRRAAAGLLYTGCGESNSGEQDHHRAASTTTSAPEDCDSTIRNTDRDDTSRSLALWAANRAAFAEIELQCLSRAFERRIEKLGGWPAMKHADLIRAVLDGKTIQARVDNSTWTTLTSAPRELIVNLAAEHRGVEYRLKPEDKVYYDVVRTGEQDPAHLRRVWGPGGLIVKVTISDDGTKKVELV